MKLKLSPKVEEVLKTGMTRFGNVVEKVIGHAKKATKNVASSQGVEPILALESQLPIPKIKELIAVSSDRIIKAIIPNLVDKSALEIREGVMRVAPMMKEKGASVAIHVDIGKTAGSYPKEANGVEVGSIRAAIKGIPFEDGFFDFVVANIATSLQGDVTRTVKEIARLVALGGGAVIVDYHPFGRFAKRGSVRLKSMESIVRGVEDYFKICKAAGLNIYHIKEAFVDETLRAHFETPEEKTSFRLVKDTPFLIFLLVNKKGGR